jgi:hypothetical protein
MEYGQHQYVHGILEFLEIIWCNKQRKNQVKKDRDDTYPSRVGLAGSPSWLSQFIKP